ncbi:hypothetical protein PR048_000419 [Dryococelus australis]|uniref:Uncharacterized protein n=1 Tax=Dryococelus australis TaxID=614101 RepID=A0ABQ9IEK7_9NEOP|nr:hypothetical protein PR048_000419 [Dryococelus australis]
MSGKPRVAHKSTTSRPLILGELLADVWENLSCPDSNPEPPTPQTGGAPPTAPREVRYKIKSQVLRADEVKMMQRRNVNVGETGDPRENMLTGGIVRHDCHYGKSGVIRSAIEPEVWPSYVCKRRAPGQSDSVETEASAGNQFLDPRGVGARSARGAKQELVSRSLRATGQGPLRWLRHRRGSRSTFTRRTAHSTAGGFVDRTAGNTNKAQRYAHSRGGEAESAMVPHTCQSSDTRKTPYDRVKRCQERKIIIKASERVNVDVFTQNKRSRYLRTDRRLTNAKDYCESSLNLPHDSWELLRTLHSEVNPGRNVTVNALHSRSLGFGAHLVGTTAPAHRRISLTCETTVNRRRRSMKSVLLLKAASILVVVGEARAIRHCPGFGVRGGH